MKLLLDENLSPALVDQLAAAYPDSRHVDQVGLHGEHDERVWSFAGEHATSWYRRILTFAS